MSFFVHPNCVNDIFIRMQKNHSKQSMKINVTKMAKNTNGNQQKHKPQVNASKNCIIPPRKKLKLQIANHHHLKVLAVQILKIKRTTKYHGRLNKVVTKNL